MKFSEGEQVLAKMPTSQEYEKAKIINVRGNKYKVQFKGGVEHTLIESDVKAQRTSRSQTRSRGRTAGKSPSRNSPSRKSPARKSPARSPTTQTRKLPVRSARQAKISIARLEMPKDNSSDTDRTEESESLKDEFIEPSSQSRLRDLGPITRRSIRIMSSASKAEQEQKLAMLRNADRAVSLPVERKIQYSSPIEGKDRGLSVQRDEDILKMNYEEDANTESEKSKNLDIVGKPQEWGGWFGALILILLMTVGIPFMQIACTNNHCSSKNFRIPHFREWKSFINLDAFLLYTGFICFVAIVSLLPVGKIVEGPQTRSGRLTYRMNGMWSLILSMAMFVGCIYRGHNIADFVIKKSLALTIVGLVYGTLLTLVLFVKGGRAPVSKLNIYGVTNNKIYDFWQGREVCPRFGPLDVKLTIFRIGLIGTILVNVAAIIKVINRMDHWEVNSVNLAPILVAIMQIIYVGDSLVFEHTMVTTFEISQEGTGFMLCVGYLIYPYLSTVTTRYLLVNEVHQPVYLQSLLFFIFLTGFFIYRYSNSQKDEFRKNPFSPSVSHLETIPTKRGKRLIVSGLWGFVRHPNYLGDILMHSAMAVSSFAVDILPYILALQVIILLVYRARRDNARCQKRYGYAWEQYCSRVRYMIIRWVY